MEHRDEHTGGIAGGAVQLATFIVFAAESDALFMTWLHSTAACLTDALVTF